MTDFGGAVGSIFNAFGDFAQASGYREAAKYDAENASYERLSGQVQLDATNRQIYQTEGKETADTAASGLTGGGSAQSLMRSSQQQAGLQRGLQEIQTNINVNADLEKEAADKAQAESATAGGVGGLIGGALGLFGI